MSQLLQDQLLDQARQPRNFRVMPNPTFVRHETNASCGDHLSLFVHSADGLLIDEATFTGQGCVISLASASLLTTYLKGRTIGEALARSEADVVGSLGMPLNPLRQPCALLPFVAFKEGVRLWTKV